MIHELPPTGRVTPEQAPELVTYIEGLVTEATDARRKWETVADDNLTIYTYGSLDYVPGSTDVVLNEIQNAIVAGTDIQTKEPPSVTLAPVETGERPVSYWAGPDVLGLQLPVVPPLEQDQVAPSPSDPNDPTSPPVPPRPLTESQADQIRVFIQQGAVPIAVPGGDDGAGAEGGNFAGPDAPAEPMQALVPIKPEYLQDIDDKHTAEVYQRVLDVLTRRSGSDLFLRRALLKNNVEGWIFPLFEFDRDNKRFLYRMTSLRQVYVDTQHVEDIREAAYAGIDVVLPLERAALQWPHLADVLRDKATDGIPSRESENVSLGALNEQSFQRNMVVVRIFWLRDQPVPMGEEEAVRAGRVVPLADPTLPEGEEAEPQYADAASGQPVTPEDDLWPTKPGIRQVTIVGGVLADDSECPHADIPLLHLVNIPIPGLPFGQGEPMRLLNLQAARNRLVNNIVQHSDYFRAPLVAVSQSMFDSLPEELKEGYITPNMLLIVPDDQWMAMGGKPGISVDQPPPTPPALIEAFQLLGQQMSEQSGHTDVLRGISPGAQTSGRALETLQQGATSLIGFKSRRLGDMVEYKTRLELHCIVRYMTVDDVQRIVSLPRHILAAYLERGKSIEWDVKVEIAAGSGSMLAAKKQEALLERQAGVISLDTYWERTNTDAQVEKQRLQVEAREMAQAAALMGGGEESGGGGEGGEKPPKKDKAA